MFHMRECGANFKANRFHNTSIIDAWLETNVPSLNKHFFYRRTEFVREIRIEVDTYKLACGQNIFIIYHNQMQYFINSDSILVTIQLSSNSCPTHQYY